MKFTDTNAIKLLRKVACEDLRADIEDYPEDERYEAAKCDAKAIMELNMEHVERENAIRVEFWERWVKTSDELKERG